MLIIHEDQEINIYRQVFFIFYWYLEFDTDKIFILHWYLEFDIYEWQYLA